MKKQIFCLGFFLLHLSANAQTFGKNAVESKNAIYFMLGGEGLILSAHYNRTLFEKGKFFVDGKVGAGIFPGLSLGNWRSSGATIFSHSASANFGVRHCLEAGVGGTYVHSFEDKDEGAYRLYPIIGYKYRSASSRFVFRSTVYPPGVSLGFAF